jgi:hypothetical protein
VGIQALGWLCWIARESCWGPNGITSAGERCCKDATLSSTNELLHKFVTGLCTHWLIYILVHTHKPRHAICCTHKPRHAMYCTYKPRHAVYCTYKRNIEARSRNHCCLGKAINITYSECVSCVSSVSYPACSAHAQCIVVCGLCVCAIFLHIVINGIIIG